MSISPFDSLDSKSLRSAQASASRERVAAETISLSQALIITAGMAGLIGLFSGVIIRFSLANSPNARFLSPLQTFPALSNWTPESLQDTASDGPDFGDAARRSAAQDEQAEAEAIRTFESSEPPDYLPESLEDSTDELFTPANDINPVDVTTFDTFADRASPSRRSESGRWEALEAGPKFRQDGAGKLRPSDNSDSGGFDRDLSADVNDGLSSQTPLDQNPSEFGYSEETYSEEAYSADVSPEEGDDSEVYSNDDFYDDYPDNY